jgi:hypothetical protein
MRTWGWIFCLLALPALASGQSLAETAQKERQRREKLHKEGVAARTVTDDDLSSAKGELANQPGAAESEAEKPAERKASESAGRSEDSARRAEENERKRKESYWRTRAAEARRRLAVAEARYRDLDRQIRIGQPLRYDENGRRTIYSQQQMKEMADEAEAELAEAKQALDDLLEAARHAGALPGWLR